MDRRRLILTGAAGLASACAPAPQVDLTSPASDDRMLFAQAHMDLRPRIAAQHFDCAVGARLTAHPMPALQAAFDAVADDLAAHLPARPGPPPGAVCIRLLPGETVRPGPSLRAALTTAYALILSRAAPDRAAAIGTRAADVVDSEVLCGLSDPAAAAEGRAIGRARFDALVEGTSEFGDLLDRAAAEVAQARRDPLESPGCAAERRTLSPLPGAD